MTTISHFRYNTTFGPLTIEADRVGIRRVVFSAQHLEGLCRPSTVTNEAANQIYEYLAGKRQHFTIPLHLEGSDFQIKVWQAVQAIPYGTTLTFGELAEQLGEPSLARQVGNALKKSTIPLFIPAHRVTNAQGNTTATDKLGTIYSSLITLEAKNSA